MLAHSVVENTTPTVTCVLPDIFPPLPSSLYLSLPFEISSLPAHSSLISFVGSPSIINKIVTPYCSIAFSLFLDTLHLSHRHAGLPAHISSGFSIGVPDSSLSDSIIPPYHPSEDDCHIDDYLQEELAADRMSGPFSVLQMCSLCNGHYVACPVHVVTTTDECSKVKHHVVRNTSFHGAASFSVNDLVDSNDFPTEWGTASQVADLVSSFLFLFFFLSSLAPFLQPCISFVPTSISLLIRA